MINKIPIKRELIRKYNVEKSNDFALFIIQLENPSIMEQPRMKKI